VATDPPPDLKLTVPLPFPHSTLDNPSLRLQFFSEPLFTALKVAYYESLSGAAMNKKNQPDIPGRESLVPGYEWIVVHPDLLGGQPAIRGTRISIAHILECLAGGMTFKEISEEYGVPLESFPDAMRYAASLAGEPRRVAS